MALRDHQVLPLQDRGRTWGFRDQSDLIQDVQQICGKTEKIIQSPDPRPFLHKSESPPLSRLFVSLRPRAVSHSFLGPHSPDLGTLVAWSTRGLLWREQVQTRPIWPWDMMGNWIYGASVLVCRYRLCLAKFSKWRSLAESLQRRRGQMGSPSIPSLHTFWICSVGVWAQNLPTGKKGPLLSSQMTFWP